MTENQHEQETLGWQQQTCLRIGILPHAR